MLKHTVLHARTRTYQKQVITLLNAKYYVNSLKTLVIYQITIIFSEMSLRISICQQNDLLKHGSKESISEGSNAIGPRELTYHVIFCCCRPVTVLDKCIYQSRHVKPYAILNVRFFKIRKGIIWFALSQHNQRKILLL